MSPTILDATLTSSAFTHAAMPWQKSVDPEWPARIRGSIVIETLQNILLHSPTPKDLVSTPWF
jgi:hypothetical protein